MVVNTAVGYLLSLSFFGAAMSLIADLQPHKPTEVVQSFRRTLINALFKFPSFAAVSEYQ